MPNIKNSSLFRVDSSSGDKWDITNDGDEHDLDFEDEIDEEDEEDEEGGFTRYKENEAYDSDDGGMAYDDLLM